MALEQIIGLVGGATQDLFTAKGYEYKAKGHLLGAQAQRLRGQGQLLEAGLYDQSALYARRNKDIARNATEIKLLQEDRKIFRTMGGQAADVAASGFAMSGSALDLMRSSAAEGALTKQVMSQQGLIEETSIEQQAESYDVMAKSSRMSATMSELAAQGEETAAHAAEDAGKAASISSAFKIGTAFGIVPGLASLFIGKS